MTSKVQNFLMSNQMVHIVISVIQKANLWFQPSSCVASSCWHFLLQMFNSSLVDRFSTVTVSRGAMCLKFQEERSFCSASLLQFCSTRQSLNLRICVHLIGNSCTVSQEGGKCVSALKCCILHNSIVLASGLTVVQQYLLQSSQSSHWCSCY